MARSHKDDVTSFKVVLTKLRRNVYFYRDQRIQDSQLYADALYLWGLCLIDILRSAEDCHTHRIASLIIDASKMDIALLALELKTLDSKLIEFFSTNWETEVITYDSFKHYLGTSNPWTAAFMGAVSGLFHLPKGRSLQSLRTACCFITRLNIKSDVLQQEAKEKFLATELRVSSHHHFDDDVRDVITGWFPRSTRHILYDNFVPRHGPGGVSDGCKSVADKYRSLCITPMLRYLLKGSTADWFDIPYGDVPPAKVTFVAKSLTGYRTICMEPAAHQWVQQGFSHSLEVYMNRHRDLRRRISLRDQPMNAELAWVGSLDGSIATIDLSDASDSVSYEMIKAWFCSSSLREVLLCSRSRFIELGKGDIVATSKFAPMGSALCFPIECIVFSAIVESVIKEAGGVVRDSNYRVYGDDIVVEAEYAKAVVDKLVRNGFVVNNDKSHISTETRFRESCGGDFLLGEDVSPLRLSRRFAGLHLSSKTPSSIQGLIDLANACHMHLPRVRLAVIEQLLSLPNKLRPAFDETGKAGIFSPEPSNFHLEWADSSDWQCRIYYCGTLKSSPTYLDTDESIRLHETLRVNRGRTRLVWPEDHTDVSVSPPGPTRWSSSRRPE